MVKGNWQKEISEAITSVDELLNILDLQTSIAGDQLMFAPEFKLLVPRAYVSRMQKGNPQDPLLLQVLPRVLEACNVEGFSVDPLAERAVSPVPGLLHKYYGRVLITMAASCALNCRFCFRRHFPYAQNIIDENTCMGILAYIANDKTITEVILSGGEPLLISDAKFNTFINALEKIEHVKILRIHSRMPIVVSARITEELLCSLRKSRLQIVVVVHCNHANELVSAVTESIDKLRAAKVSVLNQSVLLRGINDNADALIALSYKLFNSGILPYYLHMLDKVQGAAHFAVSDTLARRLLAEVQSKLPGYLVPQLVREVPRATSKTRL
ncbi:MAG: EF-P beta-lysylation protein EpmB [Gammaproteobacteria bacterium]|nr:EF-P beta-lysylation protein EpmB [Gammaproteobacteria bacterium]